MRIERDIVQRMLECSVVRLLAERPPSPPDSFVVGGVHGSSAAAVIAALHETSDRVIVAAAASPRGASELAADLRSLVGSDRAQLYPQREALPYESADPHLEVGGQQVEAVEALLASRTRLLVTTLRGLQEKAAIPSELTDLQLGLELGPHPGPTALAARLEELGFSRAPLVEAVGQYALRGGIVDVFSFGSEHPFRVEFWGDEIVSLRQFDVLDQRSIGEVEAAKLLPVAFELEGDEERNARSVLDVLPTGALIVKVGSGSWTEGADRVWERVVQTARERRARGHDVPDPDELVLEPGGLERRMARFGRIVLQTDLAGDATLPAAAAPPVDRDMRRLARILANGEAQAIETVVLCDNDGQLERLEEILAESGRTYPSTRLAVGSLSQGFVLSCGETRLRVLTDHEIFRRPRRLKRGRRFRGGASLESLSELTPGDYLVHMDHGIGRFLGLETLAVGGREIEVLAVEYADRETLHVPVYRLDLVERWVGAADGAKRPALHRVGGKRWKTLRKKTEEQVMRFAQDLLDLYARRQTTAGHAFPEDTTWQREMESSFLYEDTPDQRQAAQDVKRDMERARPMDRLVCGDVGYGKTEVAIRAAFKAVEGGKQVAFLAPTTVLAEQHRHTLEERLADYPVRIGALSRFRSSAETKQLLEDTRSGRVDILVGTHRLLSPDVRFRDLGLLIVDEEQRFGVKHKERLKEMRAAVDVLTLTATPIPRTLHLALSGLRDLSLIRTPPRDRMPIITHVLPWSDQIVGEAIQRELDRGGQVYVLHNRIETIDTVAERIRGLAPTATVTVAHGQMTGAALDRIMTDFVDGAVQIMVCSSIIENGLDVPNANTLIVDGADRFGLSQLYQIRGRVGRSDRRAFAYLVVPERVNEEADKRLRVLEHYTQLGSGYAVALKDLELRGAGNLLGADQSGFAQAVGLDTYFRLLKESITNLQSSEGRPAHPEPDVSMGGAAYLPDAYVADSRQKLQLYRRLSRLTTGEEIETMRAELADRFGALPDPVKNLLDQASLRLLGQQMGVERILVRGRTARVSFRPGVSPRLSVLDEPFQHRQVAVTVHRLSPLSLGLERLGEERLSTTLIEALAALRDERSRAA